MSIYKKMRLILPLVIFIFFTLYLENEAKRDIFPNYLRNIGFRDYDFSGGFDERESPRQSFRRSQKKRFHQLRLHRQMFFFWNVNYDRWTNWTSCSPINCTKSRYRKCKDSSWEENVIDFKRQRKCPVQFIYERMSCNDTAECKTDYSSKVNAVSQYSLPKKCGMRSSEIENRIYGGQESEKNSWPWHVGLYIVRNRRLIYICGGTLINPGWVVTAAHCLKTVDKVDLTPLGEIIDTRKYEFFDSFQIIIGDHDRSSMEGKEMTRKISHFIIHKSFRADYTSNFYDVALLKLDEVIPEKLNLNYACVPESKNYTLPVSEKCIAVGWGNMKLQDPLDIWNFEFDWYLDRWRRNRKPTRNAFVLQEVEIPLVDFQLCQRKYRYFNLNKDIHICAGSLSKDTCRGDSGGGLFCMDSKTNRWHLYGITNFGSARGCGKSYGVYIRVAEISGWIRNIIKNKSIN